MDSIVTEPEFERLVQRARQTINGELPLSDRDSKVKRLVDDWVAANQYSLRKEDWESVVHSDHPDDTMVVRYMTGDLFIRGLKETAMAVAELRECANDILDGTFTHTLETDKTDNTET